MSSEENSGENYQPQYEIISFPPRILSLLRPVQEKHTLLTVTLTNSRQLFTTAIIDIDSNNFQLTIDELHPADGNKLLAEEKVLCLHTLLDKVDLGFCTNVHSIGSTDNINYYVLNFPANVRYRQRRQAYRVPTGPLDTIPVKLTGGQKISFDGLLHDISAGGFSARFHAKKCPGEEFMNQVIDCCIMLPNKSTIICSVKLCHKNLNQTTQHMHVGCQFLDLDNAQHRAVERFVVSLQRMSRKKDER